MEIEIRCHGGSFSSFFHFIYYIYIYMSSGSGQNVTKCIPIDIFGPRDPFTFWLQFGKCQNISWSKNDFQAPCRSGPHNLHEVRVDDKRLKLMVCTCVCHRWSPKKHLASSLWLWRIYFDFISLHQISHLYWLYSSVTIFTLPKPSFFLPWVP